MNRFIYEIKMFLRISSDVIFHPLMLLGNLIKWYKKVKRQYLIADLLGTEKGRIALAKAMIDPIRKSFLLNKI